MAAAADAPERRLLERCGLRRDLRSDRSAVMTSAGSLPAAWQPQPRDQSLPQDEVHVWAALLERPALCASQMVQSLSSEERAQAELFHFPRDRQRYIIAHGFLRAVLGQYLRIDPVDVPVRSLPSGKPVLALERGADQLQFNLSHSHERALCAVARGRRLGIDLEWIRAELDVDDVLRKWRDARA